MINRADAGRRRQQRYGKILPIILMSAVWCSFRFIVGLSHIHTGSHWLKPKRGNPKFVPWAKSEKNREKSSLRIALELSIIQLEDLPFYSLTKPSPLVLRCVLWRGWSQCASRLQVRSRHQTSLSYRSDGCNQCNNAMLRKSLFTYHIRTRNKSPPILMNLISLDDGFPINW